MSWIPFRKSTAKKAENVIPGEEFNEQIEKLTRVETNSRKVYKDMKKYIEDNNGLIKVENRLGEDFLTHAHNATEEGDELNVAAHALKECLDSHTELRHTLNDNLQKCFVDPMKKVQQHYNNVSSAMKRREQSLQDYRKYLTRHEKFLEKEGTAPQSGKFDANERYLALAKSDFERRNSKLLEELPKFYDCRVTYFQPCFEGVIKSEFEYYKSTRDMFEKLASTVDCPLEQRTDDDYREDMTSRLNEIKALSIVAEK